jgi:beta-lactamase regulating signal transducer with metallopeptidase domain
MNSLLADLLNSMLASVVLTGGVWLLLRFAGRDPWNARTRETVWWLALLATVITPLLPIASSALHHFRSPFGTQLRVPSESARVVEVPSPPQAQWTRIQVAEARLRDPVLPIRFPAGWWASVIVVIWLLISLAVLVRLVVSYIRLERLKARAIEAPAELVAKVHAWMNNFQKPRCVRVLISTEIATPIVSGPNRPSIVIPQTLFNEIKSSELDQICLHEVAHLGRYDDYRLAVQRIVEALFVLHPVVGWIAAGIQLEREIACDDFVVNMTREPRAYALCLVRVAELSVAAPGSFAAPIANGRSQLDGRVDLLLNENRNRRRFLPKMRMAGVLAGFALLSTVVQAHQFLVLAATQPKKVTVTVPVTLTDHRGRYISGLEKDHFEISEDGILQEIRRFDNDVNASVSVVVVVNGVAQDATTDRVLNALTAVRHPGDEFELVRLNAWTGLMDGVLTAIDLSRSLRNARRGIVIVSPADTSVYSQEETRDASESTDVPIYIVRTPAHPATTPLLDDFARFTGGRHYVIYNGAPQFDQTIKGIVREIRVSYVLTYDSAMMAPSGTSIVAIGIDYRDEIQFSTCTHTAYRPGNVIPYMCDDPDGGVHVTSGVQHDLGTARVRRINKATLAGLDND